MKKLIYLIAVLTAPVITSAQLQNLDFEQWNNPITEITHQNSPTGWTCYNRWYGTDQAISTAFFMYPPETNSQHDTYALRLSVWYNYMKDMAVQTAPINSRPTALKGFYKYENNIIYYTEPIVDTAQVAVCLTKWNAALSKNDTIGAGTLRISTESLDYKEFEVTIEYFSEATPDAVTISLDPSLVARDPDLPYIHSGLNEIALTVDNLTLEGAVLGHGNKEQLAINTYPNPAKDFIYFDNIEGDVSIFDLAGKKIQGFTISKSQPVNVNHLAAGTYIIKIQNEKGTYQDKFIKG
jgi:hypothetical protein